MLAGYCPVATCAHYDGSRGKRGVYRSPRIKPPVLRCRRCRCKVKRALLDKWQRCKDGCRESAVGAFSRLRV